MLFARELLDELLTTASRLSRLLLAALSYAVCHRNRPSPCTSNGEAPCQPPRELERSVPASEILSKPRATDFASGREDTAAGGMSVVLESQDLIPTPAEPSATITVTNAPANHHPESNPSSNISSDMSDHERKRPPILRGLSRPKLSGRKSSGTNIIPRDHPNVEILEESFPANDARAMSPRRSSYETEKLGLDTRKAVQR